MKDLYHYILFVSLILLLYLYHILTIKEIREVDNRVEQLNTKIDLVIDSIK